MMDFIHRSLFTEVHFVPEQRHEMEFSKLFNRIPNSETFSSQPATDPNTNDDDCIGIGCWLTEKRPGTRNSKFDFAKLSDHPSGGSSEETWGLGVQPIFYYDAHHTYSDYIYLCSLIRTSYH
jgi:hypothetical protein